MSSSSYHDSFEKKQSEISFELEQEEERQKQVDEVSVDVRNFWVRLGREPIPLSLVEFRIIRFLARKPYKAFRREQIVEAVSTFEIPVTDETLDQHIRTLRDKLGLFSDYIQTVPYIGFPLQTVTFDGERLTSFSIFSSSSSGSNGLAT